jgi:hypothetical protein
MPYQPAHEDDFGCHASAKQLPGFIAGIFALLALN